MNARHVLSEVCWGNEKAFWQHEFGQKCHETGTLRDYKNVTGSLLVVVISWYYKHSEWPWTGTLFGCLLYSNHRAVHEKPVKAWKYSFGEVVWYTQGIRGEEAVWSYPFLPYILQRVLGAAPIEDLLLLRPWGACDRPGRTWSRNLWWGWEGRVWSIHISLPLGVYGTDSSVWAGLVLTYTCVAAAGPRLAKWGQHLPGPSCRLIAGCLLACKSRIYPSSPCAFQWCLSALWEGGRMKQSLMLCLLGKEKRNWVNPLGVFEVFWVRCHNFTERR